MSARSRLVAGAAVLLVGAADPVGGELTGTWTSPAGAPQPVRFQYHREAEGTGRISVELPSGEVYAGSYLRLSDQGKSSRVQRIFAAWRKAEYDRFEVGPTGQPWSREESGLERFRRKHRNRVVATLISEQGRDMRCSFALVSYEQGLPGGATGACQATDGGTIELAAPGSRGSERPGPS